jgi:hypothetical protein
MVGYTTQPLDDAIQKIKVVNRNAFTIKDRYDGIPYEFAPGKDVMLMPEVANHILGYPGDIEDMHRHMARRWGWNLPQHMQVGDDGLMVWQRQCLAIEVSTERFELRRIPADGEPIPADGEDVGTLHDTVPVGRKMTKEDRSTRMKRIWAERRSREKVTRAERENQQQPSEA